MGFVLLFFVYCGSPNAIDSGDGYLSLPTAHSLLYEHNLDLNEFSDAPWYDRHYAVTSVGDRKLDYFPWLSAVASVPVVAGWDALSLTGVVENSSALISDGSVGQIQVVSGSLVAALGAVVLGLLTRRLFTLTPGGASARQLPVVIGQWSLTVWIVTIGLGTSLWSVASRSMGQHATSVLLGAGAMLVLAHLIGDDPIRPEVAGAVALGVLVGLAYWARPTNVVLVPVVLAVLTLRKRPLLLPALVGLVSTHVAVLCANFILIGRVIPPYFAGGRVGWHEAYLEAAAANLISPARGLIVFSPFLLGLLLLLLPSRRGFLTKDVAIYVLASGAGALALLVVVSGFKESWWGGESYGPRFMTEAITLLAPLAILGFFGPCSSAGRTRWLQRFLGGALIAISVVFHMGGAAIPAVQCWNTEHSGDGPAAVWNWSEPQFLAGPEALIHSRSGAAARCAV